MDARWRASSPATASARPGASTVTGILHRNGIELGALGGGAQPFICFEHEAPKDLWHMCFTGHVALHGGRLHPLTVLDDHSRFPIALSAGPFRPPQP
ncbi:hypothetical protein ACVDG5_034965 [Mesorhizobium sp. ORM6]